MVLQMDEVFVEHAKEKDIMQSDIEMPLEDQEDHADTPPKRAGGEGGTDEIVMSYTT